VITFIIIIAVVAPAAAFIVLVDLVLGASISHGAGSFY
jgi:preprotein translocase subunit SecE